MREILRVVSAIFISTGGFINILVLIKYSRIIRLSAKLSSKLPPHAGTMGQISRAMMVFFLFGYAVGLADMLTRDVETIYYFVSAVFFIAAIFVFLIIKYLEYTLDALRDYNKNLRLEVDSQTRELRYQDKLLMVTNETAAILLASDTGSFANMLLRCMGMLAECVAVDRICIWKNHLRDGKLCCTRIYEWSEGSIPVQGAEFTVDIPYERAVPGWEAVLSSGRNIKGFVSEMSPEEQAQLTPQGVVSLLVVPVFLQGQFWGFVGFDDCHAKRDFTDSEEGILRSASLLIATCMQRNDITRSLIEAKELADRSSKTKSEFLSNMSHEIRTPINAIVGMSAIAKSADSFDKVHDCMNKIEAASRQLLAIINDILDMGKIEAGKMELVRECFDLHAALHNVRSIIGVRAIEKNLNFRLDIGPDFPRAVIGDEMRLSQILLNLLSNAVKFTPNDGTVTLESRLLEKTDDICVLQFVVTDTGIGISKEQQERLFSAFEQAESNTARRYGGTGLGLAISKRIANMMGGDIVLESEIGEGSRFIVYLTLKTASLEMLKIDAGRVSASSDLLNGRTILLAEDIEINREIAVTILGERGALVDCAENGVQALEQFTADPERYDIILMDVHMPEMDGLSATRAIRALPSKKAKSVPILAMTANAFDEDVKKCIEAGMDGHIAKPIDVDRLFKTLENHINPD